MPDAANYIALHNHSCYSLLDSTMTVDDLVAAGAEMEMPAMGLVDRDTVAGAVQFYKKAIAAGIRPVTGSEVTLASGYSLVLLVESAAGYANLCRLLTARIEESAGVSDETLNRYRQGLVCLLGARSEPGEAAMQRYREIYGRSLALEISPHNEADLRLSRWMVAAGRRMRIPVVAAADAHYRHAGDRLRYDILASIGTLTLLNQPHPRKLGPGNYHLHSPEEMRLHFGALPQAIENSRLIAERCRFDFELGDILFPRFDTGGEEPVRMLRRLAEEGIVRRYGARNKEAAARLERELKIIEEVGYAEYFLIFADIVRWCESKGIATLARGSAAGSLVCYALGISNVCPFRFGLMFERFLNKERMQFQKLADIDLDLPWDRRDEVIDYVFERYGREHVAMIGAFNTFQGRAAVGDIAKVYGIPEREVRRFTEHLPHMRGDVEAAVAEMPECAHLPWRQEPYRTILAMAGRFDGLPRHFTMHPCGLVISASPVTERMPLFRSAKGLLTTHYAMDDVEELGLLKMDLLGQAGLSVLREAAANVRSNRGVEIDTARIDEHDAPTWENIATANVRGVFHIESPNMNGLLLATACGDIECLTALESVIRPGAANEGRKRAFARRHQGLEEVTYPHPSLEPALKETYGLLVYEEHILLVANGFAGMPWGRADMLRRALVKNRDFTKIDALGEEFRKCARGRGHTEQDTERVWKTLREFAGYMFNKAHSAAYAVEAYQGAWIKAHYPVEFLASVLSNRRGFYAPIVYVLETLRCGGRFVAPDVQVSDPHKFLVEGETVRLPLDQVKGLNAGLVERIAEERPFRDAGDYFRRARPQHADWLALLKVGALDSLGEPRGRMFWRLCRLEASAGKGAGLLEPEMPETVEAGVKPEWEYELLGFPVSCHPLDYFAAGVDWRRFQAAGEMKSNAVRYFGTQVDVCGLIVADRIHPTERGAMKFVTLADYTGFHEVCLFPETYRDYGHVTVQPVVAVRAKVEPLDNRRGFTLVAERVTGVRAGQRAAVIGG
jgi:DNA-directed DNA polymerase III PolC